MLVYFTGYFLCTAEWFREFTYEIIVPRKLAPPECVKILDAGNPVTLPPWVS
jgi:bleomycin hydrolase